MSYLSQLPKIMLLLLASVLLTTTTVVLGAIPLRLLRKSYGRTAFCFGVGAVFLGLLVSQAWIVAAAFAILAIIVGFYTEFETQGASIFMSGLVAVMIGAAITGAGVTAWMKRSHSDLIGMVKEQVQNVAERALALNPQANLDVDAVMTQMPSFLFIVVVVSLAAALIWERRVTSLLRLQRREALRGNLLDFRIPDAFVWVAIVAALGAFVEHSHAEIRAVSLNFVNVIAAAYFFQGLAVVASLFRVQKVGWFWQTFWYVIFFVQLFPLVAIIGLADFWIDFRKRMLRNATSLKTRI